jgi:uncharacterized protein involved in exopolysaccharide biosynthesis
LSPAFVFLLGVVNLARAIPLYTATTRVPLEHHEKAPGMDAVVNDRGLDDCSYLDNQLAILQSESLLRRMVIKERLAPPNTKELQAAAQNKDDPTPMEGAIIDGINRLLGVGLKEWLPLRSRPRHGLRRLLS